MFECVSCGCEFESGYEYCGQFVCDDCLERNAIGVIANWFNGERCLSEEDEFGCCADAIRVDGEIFILDEIDAGEFLEEHGAERVRYEEDDGSDRAYEEARDRRFAA